MSHHSTGSPSSFTPWRSAVFALAALAIAWPSAEPVARSGLAGSEWRVAEIEGRDAAGGGTLRFTVTSVRGKAACNTFFGSFREAGKSIKIDGINSTRMHCNGQMQLERQFLAALSKATAYRIESGTLLLTAPDGRVLVRLDA